MEAKNVAQNMNYLTYTDLNAKRQKQVTLHLTIGIIDYSNVED